MQIIDEFIEVPESLKLLSDFYPGKRIMMFDIETTGLSAFQSFIYIIGVNEIVDGKWRIRQYFNDDGMSEPEIIEAFEKALPDYDAVIEFNGDKFDFPFVEKRMGQIQMKTGRQIENNHNRIQKIDLMKLIFPYKFALGLPNIKQKTIERYLGIHREDKYNGGELISIYLDYLSDNDSRKKHLVLQHNRDDMVGMISLLPILSIHSVAKGSTTVPALSTKEKGSKLYLCLSGQLKQAVPETIEAFAYHCNLKASGKSICLEVPLEKKTLLYFTPGGSGKVADYEKTSLFAPGLSTWVNQLMSYKESGRNKECFYEVNDAFLGNGEALMNYMGQMCGLIMEDRGKNR